jgi:predicted nucleotidyltransferase
MPEKLDFITPRFLTVFELFLADPLQEYHEREVVRRTGVSKGSANKMLRLLADLRFLIRATKGRMAFYKLNAKDPAVRQFKIFVNIYALKSLLELIKERCRKIVLFGSCAQGTDVKESDIDLFVLASEKDFIRRKISKFNSKNKRRIAPIIVDANEFVKLKTEDKPLYENIEAGIVLWQTE